MSDDRGKISDGYHTFDELYEHRHALFIALCRRSGNQAWRSPLHADGSMFPGWFVMGLNTAPGEQITYHLPIGKWPDTDFARTRPTAPEWDGHTSGHVLARIAKLR